MNISYNWLKEYVNFDLTPDETAAALTSIGLETGGVEVQTIKGGLEGLVIGEVLICRTPAIPTICISLPSIWGDGEPCRLYVGLECSCRTESSGCHLGYQTL